jgi:hypothetical protein
MSSRTLSRYLVGVATLLVFSIACGGAEPTPPDIQVELNSQKPLSLRVTLWSRAETRVALPTWRLPWGNRNSMILLPVDRDRQCFDNKYFAEEYPDYRKVLVDPNGSISGDIDLQRILPGLEKELKKSDIHLFWAYEAPEELHIAHWSGGWILIPQRH